MFNFVSLLKYVIYAVDFLMQCSITCFAIIFVYMWFIRKHGRGHVQNYFYVVPTGYYLVPTSYYLIPTSYYLRSHELLSRFNDILLPYDRLIISVLTWCRQVAPANTFYKYFLAGGVGWAFEQWSNHRWSCFALQCTKILIIYVSKVTQIVLFFDRSKISKLCSKHGKDLSVIMQDEQLERSVIATDSPLLKRERCHQLDKNLLWTAKVTLTSDVWP